MARVTELNPATYQRHLIHGEQRVWPETNCYTDVIIELLHGLGREPIAALPFAFAIDFEGDQWTFFKFPDSDLDELYGFDVQELAIWRSLVDHVVEQVDAGRPVLVELDSFFLPDTAGSAYKLSHVKTTVAVNEIDPVRRHLGYFHNQGYFELQGDDFDAVFQVNGLVHDRMLPPYVEYVKLNASAVTSTERALVDSSLALFSKHITRIPARNPFLQFKARFERDLEWLMESNIEKFHAYSFATLRQFGACFELTNTYLLWLTNHGIHGLESAANSFLDISQSAKALQFQFARSMARKRPLDLSPLDQMAILWETGMGSLRPRWG